LNAAEPTVLVIGIGNELRGDDAAGLEVVRRLREEPGVSVREHQGEPTELLDLWEGVAAVVLVDAVRSGAAPGTIHRVDASSEPVPVALRRSSSHLIGVAEVLELGRALARLPPTVILYGVEGSQFALGTACSEPVTAAISPAVAAVLAEARSAAVRRCD
jgi:hydrogenase maturation protease